MTSNQNQNSEDVHTHILQDFTYGKEQFNVKCKRFKRYLAASCGHNIGCRGKIISMVRKLENQSSAEESENDQIQEVLLERKPGAFLTKIREIVENRNYNITEILSNQRDVHHEFKESNNVRCYVYTVFENELIVPHRPEISDVSNVPQHPAIPRGQNVFKNEQKLHVFIDGSNVGQYKRNERDNLKEGINFDNIRKCIKYLEDFRIKIKSETRVIIKAVLPKDLYMNDREREIVKDWGKYIHRVDVISQGVSEDDRYILEMAVGRNALVVSNDRFRDLSSEKTVWKHIIDNRVVTFLFVELQNKEIRFELTEVAKNIYKYYLTGRFPFNSLHVAYSVSGFGKDVEVSDIKSYLNIRGVTVSVIKIRPKFEPSLLVDVYLMVVKNDSQVLLSNGFWPNGVKCMPDKTW